VGSKSDRDYHNFRRTHKKYNNIIFFLAKIFGFWSHIGRSVGYSAFPQLLRVVDSDNIKNICICTEGVHRFSFFLMNKISLIEQCR
jgi:hypothetical protein